MGPDTWGCWEADGNVILPDLFKWLWDGVTFAGTHEAGVRNYINLEFDAYLHHQTERNGATNKGWLRTMFYSLTPSMWCTGSEISNDNSGDISKYS